MAASAGEAERAKRHGAVDHPLDCESCGRLGSAGIEVLGDLVTTAAANENCSPYAVGGWRLSWSVCCYLRKRCFFCEHLVPRCGKLVFLKGAFCYSLVNRSTETETERETVDRHIQSTPTLTIRDRTQCFCATVSDCQ